MWAPGCNVPLIRFLTLYVYCLLVYIICFPTYLFSFTFSLLIYLDPLRFQARYYKWQLNLALVFVFILYCICIVFWLVNACFCRVGFSYFPYQAKRLARGNVSKMTCFVSSGTSNHNSINSQLVHIRFPWRASPLQSPWYSAVPSVIQRSSVRLSRQSTAATGGFAAELGRGQHVLIYSCCRRVTCGPRKFWSECMEVRHSCVFDRASLIAVH